MRMWLLIIVCVMVSPFLQGCAMLPIDVVEARGIKWHGDYCEIALDARVSLRNRLNKRLGEAYGHGAWVRVNCPGDAPTPTSWRP